MYYATIIDGYIVCISEKSGNVVIPHEQYLVIISKIHDKPTTPIGYVYRLRADTLEWELVELPPVQEPELTDEEALEILLGGAGE